MKFKQYHFDVEMVIDHNIEIATKQMIVSSHHTKRGLSLKELNDLIKLNNVPEDENTKITFIIRGVNF